MRVTSLIFAGALALVFQGSPCAAQGTAPGQDAAPQTASDRTGLGRVGSLSPGEAKRAARARRRAAAASAPAPAPHAAKVAARPPAPPPVAAARPQKPASTQTAERAVRIQTAERPQRTTMRAAEIHRPTETRAPNRPLVAAHRPSRVDKPYADNDGARYRRLPPRFYAGYPTRYVLADGTVVYARRPGRRFWRFYAGYPRFYPGPRYVISGAQLYAAPQPFGPPPVYAGAGLFNQSEPDGQ